MNIENSNKANKEKNKEVSVMASWKEEMGRYLGELTGHVIGVDHIHSDEGGWFYYIAQKSLEANHPLIMNHYRGPLFVAIPYREYEDLESGKVDPKVYVDNAFWSFGFYWGGGSLIGGSYWQPFEDKAGIHDKARIDKYLTILSCRTLLRSSGYGPTEEKCNNCHLDTCYCSKVKEHCEVFPEEDLRVTFFHEMAKRVEREIGLKLKGMCIHLEEANKVVLTPDMSNPDTMMLNIPVSLNNELLYHPGQRDWATLCDSFEMELTSGLVNGEHARIEGDTIEARKEFAWTFLETSGVIRRWNDWTKRMAAFKVRDAKPEEEKQEVAPVKVGFFRKLFPKVSGK